MGQSNLYIYLDTASEVASVVDGRMCHRETEKVPPSLSRWDGAYLDLITTFASGR